MIGMSWAQAVPPAGDAVSTTSVDEAEANNAVDTFALNVEEYAAVDFAEFGYADEDELRDVLNGKFINWNDDARGDLIDDWQDDDGKFKEAIKSAFDIDL